MKKIKIFFLILIIIISFESYSFAGKIEYLGKNDGIISTENNLFLEFKNLLPGDTVSDFAYITNSSDELVYIYFKPEIIPNDEYDTQKSIELLELLKLKIKLNDVEDKTIYSGKLGANLVKKYLYLGKYKSGEESKLSFELQVPFTLKNSYALTNTKVKWIFAVSDQFIDDRDIVGDYVIEDADKEPEDNDDKENKEDKEDKNNNSSKNEVDSSKNDKKPNNQENKNNIFFNNNSEANGDSENNTGISQSIVDISNTVKTGDNIIFVLEILLFSIISFVILIIYKKKGGDSK